MANVYFGLKVNNNLTEVPDGRAALLSLGLDTRDIEAIKGLTDPYNVVRTDFKTLSGLDFDLEKVATSLQYETDSYANITTNFYDESALIDANLNINGQLAASSIKYLYADFTTAIPTIKAADISTSRVSSWSSFDIAPTLASPIFYGGKVSVTNGVMEFSNLNVRSTILAKRFDSEVPTHTIKIPMKTVILGVTLTEDVYVYAMKGIPLTYTGYFRAASVSLVKNALYPTTGTSGFRPSWIIRNVDNNFEYVYRNVLSGSTSTISINDTVARQRNIEIYYPTNGITSLTLTSISLVELPAVNLPNLATFNISNNDLREFPDLTGYTGLTTLNISYNNLARSPTLALQTFTQSVVSRMPTTLVTLTMGYCYGGECTANLSVLTNLVNLTLSTPVDARRLTGNSPAVNGSTIQTYNISGNNFSTLDASVKTSTTLRFLYLNYNSIIDDNLTINSPELELFNSYYNNSHNLLNVSGKTKLKTYAHYSITPARGASDVTNIFTGCAALTSIVVMYSPVTGRIPGFIGCTALQSVDFYATNIQDAATGFVLTNTTFDSCRLTLRSFRIYSPDIGTYDSGGTILQSEFESDCFLNMKALTSIYITSVRRGISGILPSFTTALNLQSITIFDNFIGGTIPTFASNLKLTYLYLNNNRFTGSVPNIVGPANFNTMYLSNNLLTSFSQIESTSLKILHLAYNRIPTIPDMSNLTRLQEFRMNNQQAVTRVTYTTGSFVGMIALKSLDISNNNITRGNIDQIIKDLNANYNLLNRTGVYINLRGNASPSTATAPAVPPEDDIPSILTRLRAAGWTVLTN